jgi:hypothetical protein
VDLKRRKGKMDKRVREIASESKKIHEEFPTNWPYHAPDHFEKIYSLLQTTISLASFLSEKDESILDLKHQISLEIAHSQQAEERIKSLTDGIEAEIKVLQSEDVLYNEDEMIERLKKLIEG